MNNIGAQILSDLYDHFCAYFSFSVLFFQELVPVTLFLDDCFSVAVACLIHIAEKHLKIYVCDLPTSN